MNEKKWKGICCPVCGEAEIKTNFKMGRNTYSCGYSWYPGSVPERTLCLTSARRRRHNYYLAQSRNVIRESALGLLA